MATRLCRKCLQFGRDGREGRPQPNELAPGKYYCKECNAQYQRNRYQRVARSIDAAPTLRSAVDRLKDVIIGGFGPNGPCSCGGVEQYYNRAVALLSVLEGHVASIESGVEAPQPSWSASDGWATLQWLEAKIATGEAEASHYKLFEQYRLDMERFYPDYRGPTRPPG